MKVWLSFLFGTPKRFLGTTMVLMVALGSIRPDLLEAVLTNVLTAVVNAVAPLVEPLLMLAIVILGFKMILRGIFPGKGKKK